MPMSAMKARFQIAECSSLYQKKEGRDDFRKTALRTVTFSLFRQKRGLVRDMASSLERRN